MKTISILFSILFFLFSCNKASPDILKHELIAVEPYETSVKAQLTVYTIIDTAQISKDKINTMLVYLYDSLQDYTFKKFDHPNAMKIFAHASLESINKQNGSWIAMLTKTISDPAPEITFSNWRIDGIKDQQDGFQSKEEIIYKTISSKLAKKGTDICGFLETLYALEKQSNKEANLKYAEYSDNNTNYAYDLYEKRRLKLFSKMGLNDTMDVHIIVYAMTRCN